MIPWVLVPFFAALLLVGATAVGYKHGRESGAHEIQAQWDEEKAQAEAKAQELQTNMDTLREKKNAEIAKLSRNVRALNDSLRDRPSRGMSESAENGNAWGGCSGPQLYREDAAVVVAEAERADQIRLQLIACQQMYRQASGQ